MLNVMNLVISKLAQEILPEDIKLYDNDGVVLFKVRGSSGIIEDANITAIFLCKLVQGFRFTYCIKFKDLQLLQNNVVDKAIPYIKAGIEEAIAKFRTELADTNKIDLMVEAKKKEQAEFQYLQIQ